MSCELIGLKLHWFPCFNIINSEENGIVGGKSVRPTRPCRVCFWPVTTERLPTPDLPVHMIVDITNIRHLFAVLVRYVERFELLFDVILHYTEAFNAALFCFQIQVQ